MKSCVLYIIVIAAILTQGCGRGVPPYDYVKYVENPNNGLKLKQEVNGMGYTLQYEPIPYCVMLEKRSFSVPSDVFKEEYKRFEGLEHYTFKIERNKMDSLVGKLGDSSRYKNAITNYFDFQIQKDIKLVEGHDTIYCGVCQVDAGMADSYTFTLGFSVKNENIQEQNDREFLFSNKILHTGNIAFEIKNKDLKNIPVLKTM